MVGAKCRSGIASSEIEGEGEGEGEIAIGLRMRPTTGGWELARCASCVVVSSSSCLCSVRVRYRMPFSWARRKHTNVPNDTVAALTASSSSSASWACARWERSSLRRS